MPEAIKKFNFNTNTEGWEATPLTNIVGSRNPDQNSVNDNAGGSGALQMRNATQNNSRTGNFWEWVGTWESLGVPAGATVQAVNVAYDWRCSEYTSGTGNNRSGPMQLRDGAGTTLRHTFSAVQASVSGVTNWATVARTQLAGLSEASNISIRFRLLCDLRTANTSGAVTAICQDWIVVSIIYELPQTEEGGSNSLVTVTALGGGEEVIEILEGGSDSLVTVTALGGGEQPERWQGTKIFTGNDYYNAADLNRENANIQHMYGELLDVGFYVRLPKPIKTDYARTDFPTVSAVNNARANLKALVDVFYTMPAPAVVVNPLRKQRFGMEEANTLEINLQMMYDLLALARQAFKHSGTFSCGEELPL